jgi:hypothetical protein
MAMKHPNGGEASSDRRRRRALATLSGDPRFDVAAIRIERCPPSPLQVRGVSGEVAAIRGDGIARSSPLADEVRQKLLDFKWKPCVGEFSR